MKGFQKLVEILRNAPEEKFTSGMMYRESSDSYCSIGIVAKELGYRFEGSVGFGDVGDFVAEKLEVDPEDISKIVEWNDQRCYRYSCVADLVEDVLINGNADPYEDYDYDDDYDPEPLSVSDDE